MVATGKVHLGRAVSGRRRHREIEQGRHADRRQDRHPHRRQACLEESCASSDSTDEQCCGWRQAWTGQRASAGGRSSRRRLSGTWRWCRPDSSRNRHRRVRGCRRCGAGIGQRRADETGRYDVAAFATGAEKLRAEGASVMYLARDGVLAGLPGVADPIKASTPDAVGALRQAGMRVVMATGDGLTTAQAVARVSASMRSSARSSRRTSGGGLSRAGARGRQVAMAGDGVDDAPALAGATSASPWARAPTSR